MPPKRQPISLELKREYNNVRPKGKLSDIIDFHLNGKNRYLKINQPANSNRSRLESIRSSPRDSSVNNRNWTRFKNPKLNRYEDSGEEEYERKHYVFEYHEEEDENESNRKTVKKTRRKVKHKKKKNNLKEGEDEDENSEDADRQVDEKKVGETVKMIEDLLKDKKKRSKRNRNESSEVNGEDDLTEEERDAYLKEKNIQINKSTKDSDDVDNLAKKPKKRNINSDNIEYKNTSTQTPRELYIQLKNDHLQYAPNAKSYLSGLINDVEKINQDYQKKQKQEKSDLDLDTFDETKDKLNQDETKSKKNKKKPKKDDKKNDQLTENENEDLTETSVIIGGENDDKTNDDKTKKSNKNNKKKDLNSKSLINFDQSNKIKSKSTTSLRRLEQDVDPADLVKKKPKKGLTKNTSSLGLSMEGKNGINMAIIKDKSPGSDKTLNEEENGVKDSELDLIKSILGNDSEQILLRKNYQNIENLIDNLMEQDSDNNYLKLAKLNRLKVLLELSMKLVGRKYKDLSNEERNNLDLQANRFHTTYPLPGEENLLEEIDEDGNKKVRMPLKIVQEEGQARIDVNNKYRVDPSEFLKIYSNNLISHAQNTTGLEFDNITVTIPAAYGAQQREAIKNSLNHATDRDDVKILTRPVAASVILNNQKELSEDKISDLSNTSIQDKFNLVFDITESSLDASVIKIKDAKDFQVVSNVGDTSFGLHDVDERIVEHIIKEKFKKDPKSSRLNDVETVNAYTSLVKNIKEQIIENGIVSVDLNDGDVVTKKDNEVLINKNLISKVLCKDIYDWSLAHMDKAINQAEITENDLDEIIIIGTPSKMPGFYEYLKEAYPKKNISFVPEEDLAVGAAIVGRKLKYQQIKVTEVLCRSIGIGLYTGVITYLLFRNSSLPCVGGCIYSTLVDDQETMVLDVYEGERPHVKFCRYLGEVTIFDLPKGEAGKVKCEVYLKMNNEGLLEVTAKEVGTGAELTTMIDANPDNLNLNPDEVNNHTDLDPIEAERYKKPDYDFVYELELLDEYLETLMIKYRKHKYSKMILDKIFNTKEWLYKNRRNVTINETQGIRNAIDRFLKNMESVK